MAPDWAPRSARPLEALARALVHAAAGGSALGGDRQSREALAAEAAERAARRLSDIAGEADKTGSDGQGDDWARECCALVATLRLAAAERMSAAEARMLGGHLCAMGEGGALASDSSDGPGADADARAAGEPRNAMLAALVEARGGGSAVRPRGPHGEGLDGRKAGAHPPSAASIATAEGAKLASLDSCVRALGSALGDDPAPGLLQHAVDLVSLSVGLLDSTAAAGTASNSPAFTDGVQTRALALVPSLELLVEAELRGECTGVVSSGRLAADGLCEPLAVATASWLERRGGACERMGSACRALAAAPVLRAARDGQPGLARHHLPAVALALEQVTLLLYRDRDGSATTGDDVGGASMPWPEGVIAAPTTDGDRAREAMRDAAHALRAIAPLDALATSIARALWNALGDSSNEELDTKVATAATMALTALAECAGRVPRVAEGMKVMVPVLRRLDIAGASALRRLADGLVCSASRTAGALDALLEGIVTTWAHGTDQTDWLAALVVWAVAEAGAEASAGVLRALVRASSLAVALDGSRDDATCVPSQAMAEALLIAWHAASADDKERVASAMMERVSSLERTIDGEDLFERQRAAPSRALRVTAFVQLITHMHMYMHFEEPPAWLVARAATLMSTGADVHVRGPTQPRPWCLKLQAPASSATLSRGGDREARGCFAALSSTIDAAFCGVHAAAGNSCVVDLLDHSARICLTCAAAIHPQGRCDDESGDDLCRLVGERRLALAEAHTVAERSREVHALALALLRVKQYEGACTTTNMGHETVLGACKALPALVGIVAHQAAGGVAINRVALSLGAVHAGMLGLTIAHVCEILGEIGGDGNATEPTDADVSEAMVAVASALESALNALEHALGACAVSWCGGRPEEEVPLGSLIASSAPMEAIALALGDARCLSDGERPPLLSTERPPWVDALFFTFVAIAPQPGEGCMCMEEVLSTVVSEQLGHEPAPETMCALAVSALCSIARAVCEWRQLASGSVIRSDALREQLLRVCVSSSTSWGHEAALAALGMLTPGAELQGYTHREHEITARKTRDLAVRFVTMPGTDQVEPTKVQRAVRETLLTQLCASLKRLHAMDRAASMEHAWTILSGDCLLRLIGSLESPCFATTAQTRAVLSMIAALARGCSEMRGEVRRVFSRIGGKRTAILLSSVLIPREKIALLHRLSTKASEADGALPASDPVAYASQPPAAIRADALAAIDACYREVGGGDGAEVPPPDDDTREGAEGVLVALVSYCADAISTNDAPTRVRLATQLALVVAGLLDEDAIARTVGAIASKLEAAVSREDYSAVSLALHAVAECMRACSPRDRAESRSTGRAARPSGRASVTARVKGAPVVASKQAKPGADDAARAVFDRMGVRPAKTGARRDDQEDTDAQCTYSVSGSHFMEQHWYFCYTCNLTSSKGMCSACARHCHAGHDVVYSRKSRFFCDCGAGSSNLPRCRCVSQSPGGGEGGPLRAFTRRRPLPKTAVSAPSNTAGHTLPAVPSSAVSLLEADPWLGAPEFADSIAKLASAASAQTWQGLGTATYSQAQDPLRCNTDTPAARLPTAAVRALHTTMAARVLPKLTSAVEELLPKSSASPGWLASIASLPSADVEWTEHDLLVAKGSQKLPQLSASAQPVRMQRGRATSIGRDEPAVALACSSGSRGIAVTAEGEVACVWDASTMAIASRSAATDTLPSPTVQVQLGHAAKRVAVCTQAGYEGYVATAGARGACSAFVADLKARAVQCKVDIPVGVRLMAADAGRDGRDRASASASRVDVSVLGAEIVGLEWASGRAPWLMVAVGAGVEIIDTAADGLPVVAVVSAPPNDALVDACTARDSEGTLVVLALTASGKVVSAAARDAGASGDAEDRGAVRVCTFDATLFAEGFPSPDSPAAPPGAALHWSEHLHAVVVAWDGMVPLLCVAAPDLRTLVGRPVMFPAACARLARAPSLAARREGRPECVFIEDGAATAGLVVMAGRSTREIVVVDIPRRHYVVAKAPICQASEESGGAVGVLMAAEKSSARSSTSESWRVPLLLARAADGRSVAFHSITHAAPPWDALLLPGVRSEPRDEDSAASGGGVPASSDASTNGRRHHGERPTFAFDFFESCECSTAETTITGNQLRPSDIAGDSDAVAQSLASESGFVEGPPGGFTISAEYVGASGRAIAGARVHVGARGSSHTPTEVRVGPVVLPITSELSRWYDLPFSAVESLSTQNRLAIHVGTCASERSTPRLSGVEIYTQSKEQLLARADEEAKEAQQVNPRDSEREVLAFVTGMVADGASSGATECVGATLDNRETPSDAQRATALCGIIGLIGAAVEVLPSSCDLSTVHAVVQRALQPSRGCFERISTIASGVAAALEDIERADEATQDAFAPQIVTGFGSSRADGVLARLQSAVDATPARPGVMLASCWYQTFRDIALAAAAAERGYVRDWEKAMRIVVRICARFMREIPGLRTTPAAMPAIAAVHLVIIMHTAARATGNPSCLEQAVSLAAMKGVSVECWATRQAVSSALTAVLVGARAGELGAACQPEAGGHPMTPSALTAQLRAVQIRDDQGDTSRPGASASRTREAQAQQQVRARAAAPTEFACDVCGDIPIIGTRWHCLICQDYDLCEQCYLRQRDTLVSEAIDDENWEEPDFDAETHNSAHPMVAMNAAAPAPARRAEATASGSEVSSRRDLRTPPPGALSGARPRLSPRALDKTSTACCTAVMSAVSVALAGRLESAESTNSVPDSGDGTPQLLGLCRAIGAGLVHAAHAGSERAARCLVDHIGALATPLAANAATGMLARSSLYHGAISEIATLVSTQRHWAPVLDTQDASEWLMSALDVLPALMQALEADVAADCEKHVEMIERRRHQSVQPVPAPQRPCLALPRVDALMGSADRQMVSDDSDRAVASCCALDALAKLLLAASFSGALEVSPLRPAWTGVFLSAAAEAPTSALPALEYLLRGMPGAPSEVAVAAEAMRKHLGDAARALSGSSAAGAALTYCDELILLESLSGLTRAANGSPAAWNKLVAGPGVGMRFEDNGDAGDSAEATDMLKAIAWSDRVTSDAAAELALGLLAAALSSKDELENGLRDPSAGGAVISVEELVTFARGAVLERASFSCRKAACAVLRRSWALGGTGHEAGVVARLPDIVALLPAYGERGSELLAWVGEILVADGAAASHFEGSVETLGALLDSIGQVGAVIREHPHASTYASLGRIIDLPGYYLDATPCTVCSSPAPLPTMPVCREAPASSAGAADSERVPAHNRASSASSREDAVPVLGGSALQLTSMVLDSSWPQSVRFTSRGLLGLLPKLHTLCSVSIAVRDARAPGRRPAALANEMEAQGRIGAGHASYGHRRVRSVSVYCSCRPGVGLNELRSDAGAWHRVAAVSLPIDAQASETCVLKLPAAASAVMLEIDGFHPGASSNDAMICPRCSQIVVDKHGVCDYCRENAYQCRNCRNINYDDLDGFMCNECGYSKYGRLEATLQVVEGVRSPCEPVTDDESSRLALAALETFAPEVKQQARLLEGHQRSLLDALEGNARIDAGAPASGLEVCDKVRAYVPIRPSVVSVSQLYCSKLRKASDSLARVQTHVRAARAALGARLDMSGGDCDGPNSWRRLLSAQTLQPRSGSARCYGCAVAHAADVVQVLSALAGAPSGTWPRLLGADDRASDVAMLLGTLVPAFEPRSREVARTYLARLASVSPDASRSICCLVRERVRAALASHASVDMGAVISEELALLQQMAQQDVSDLSVTEWESRLRLAVELLLAGLSTGADDPAVARHVLRPCVRILAKAAVPARGGASENAEPWTEGEGVASALVDASAWVGGDQREGVRAHTRRKALLKHKAAVSRPELSAAQVALRWKKKARAAAERRIGPAGEGWSGQAPNPAEHGLAHDAGGWVAPLLLSSCAPLRDEAASLMGTVASASAHAKLELLAKLVGMLDAAIEAGEYGCTLYGMILDLINEDDAALFLAARGGVAKIAALLARQAAGMVAAENEGREGDAPALVSLGQLTKLLGRMVSLRPARARAVAAGAPLTSMISVVGDLQSLLTTACTESRECADAVQGFLSVIAADSAECQSATVRHIALKLSSLGASGLVPATLRQSVILLELLSLIITPPKEEPDYLLILSKSPTQEEFIRGGMGRAPHSCKENSLVLMRDVKNYICRSLDMLGLLDDDLSMELLVAGRIIALDLPVAQVYEQIWRRHAADSRGIDDADAGDVRTLFGGGARGILHALLNAQPGLAAEMVARGTNVTRSGSAGTNSPLFITYRLQGLDGDATEPMVDSLDNDEEDGEDPEVAFACTSVMAACGGLATLVRVLRASAGGASLGARGARAACLRVLRACARLRANRRALLDTGALAHLIAAAVDMLRVDSKVAAAGSGAATAFEDDDSVQEMMMLLGAIVEEAGAQSSGEGIAITGEAGAHSLDAAAQTGLFVAQLRDACAQGKPRVADAVARLLPFLTMGEAAAMDQIATHFTSVLSGLDESLGEGARSVVAEAELAAAAAAQDPVGGADVGEGEAEGEWTEAAPELVALAQLALAVPGGARGAAQRCALMRAGAVTMAAQALLAVFGGDGWVKGGAAWWHAVREGSALQLVRVLLGSCAPPVADHEDSGAELCAVRDGNVLALLHALEGASGTRQLGGCAEELLDALSAGVDATGGLAAPAPGSSAARVSALRLATRESNRRRAEERRASLLAELGFERRMSGVSVGSAVSPSPLAGTSPMDALDIGSAGSSALASTPPGSDGTAAISIPMASTPPSSGAMMATVVASPISARSFEFEGFNVDDLEDEEDGDLVCVVCREGYGLRPIDAVGVYCLCRRVRVAGGRPSGESDGAGGAVGVARAVRSAPWSRSATGGDDGGGEGGSPSMLSLQSAFVSTSHFNVIHTACHADARRADASLRTPKREWDGASLRNNGTPCNNLLPIRAPSLPTADYDRAATAWFDRLETLGPQSAANALQRPPTHSDPGGRFSAAANECAVLINRVAMSDAPVMGGVSASGASSGSGSGATAAAARLLVPMMQLAHWALARAGAAVAENVRLSVLRRVSEASKAFDAGADAPEAWTERLLVEAALCLPAGEWQAHRASFVRYALRRIARESGDGSASEDRVLEAAKAAAAVVGCGEIVRAVACGGSLGEDAKAALSHAGEALADGPALLERLLDELVELVAGVYESESVSEALDAAELLSVALESGVEADDSASDGSVPFVYVRRALSRCDE